MKVALVRREFRRSRGGAERYGNRLAQSLVDSGHEVHLFAARVDDDLPKAIVHHPIRSIEMWSPLRRWMFYKKVSRILDRDAFDIVQALEPYAPYDVYQAGDGFHRFWLTIPEARSSWLTPQHPVKLELERRAFAPGNYARIIAPSRMVARQATRLYRVPASRIDVIQPPVDVARFAAIDERDRDAARSEWGVESDAIVCAFVGLNYSRKGLPTLLNALARLDSRFHVVVVGRDRRADSFKRRARRLGLSERVHFVGKLGGIDRIVAGADAFVLPSLYDPFGLVVQEAMAAGLPVVVSERTGAADLIRHGENGYVLRDERSAEELASHLLEFAEPVKRSALGRNARETLVDLSPERHVAEVLDVYERVLMERTREPSTVVNAPRVVSLGEVVTEEKFATTLARAEVCNYAAMASLPVVRTLHAVRPERRTDLVRVGATNVVRKIYEGDARGAPSEWRALLALANEGLLGPPPLAMASAAAGSAVLMEFIEGEEQLDHWGRRQLERLQGRERARMKRRILDALADHVREFHAAGFTHRDLYLCHVWIREKPDLQLRFMDLHRVEKHVRVPRRLRVKDLAALHFSASHWIRPTRSDEVRFFERYLGVPTLAPAHRRLSRAVLRKSARIAHHNRGREI